MSTTISDAASTLLDLLEHEAKLSRFGKARCEMDGDSFVVSAATGNGRFHYSTISGVSKYPTSYTRANALRCLESWIKRDTEAAVAEVAAVLA